MAEQVQKRPAVSRRKEAQQAATAQAAKTDTKSGEALKAELDDLLDEIDGVLETNAEEFVKGYIQKGGQ